MARIPLFPLSNALFPDGILQLQVFEVRYLDMIRRCRAEDTPFGVVILFQGHEVRSPTRTDTPADIATMARIDTCEPVMPGVLAVRCTGTVRCRLNDAQIGPLGLWTAQTIVLPDDRIQPIPATLQPSADALGRFIAGLQHDRLPAERWPLAPPFRLDECGWVANRWAELLGLPARDKRDLLAELDPIQRLDTIQSRLREHGLLA